MRGIALDAAREFLARKRIAVVGVSRNEKDFSREVLRALVKAGYDVVPVNPALDLAEGRTCYPHVQDAKPPVEAALLLTPPAQTEEVVRDCARAGVRHVWMHRGMGAGSASAEALRYCDAQGISVVTDLCPFMALEGSGFPHRLHARLRTRFGRPRLATV
jgi:predicted CoA-binding protein